MKKAAILAVLLCALISFVFTRAIFSQQAKTDHISEEQGMGADRADAPELTDAQKKTLLSLARTTIEDYVREGDIADLKESDFEDRLRLTEGAFVTIRKDGQLRGCIGNIIGQGPLYKTVRDMAIAAAVRDPRFPPLQKDELDDIEVEISVLSQPRKMKNIDEFQTGVHGAIVSRGFHQGVFLPQVATETGWDKEEFLSYLCAHKAGLAPDAWKDPATSVEIFTADVFEEEDFKR